MNGLRRVPVSPAEGREAPPTLLAELREIDPTVELIHFGGGDWRLGSIRKTDTRSSAGEEILAMEAARSPSNPKNVLLGKLLKEGFAQIAQYKCKGDPSFSPCYDGDGWECSIVEDLRERDFNWRRDGGAAKFAERLAHTNGSARDAAQAGVMHEYIINDGRDHYRREMRNRVTFGAAGMTGGAGRIIHP